jgi:hypothetical protein
MTGHLLRAATKLLKVMPARYRSHVKTAGRAAENLPAFVRGFLFSSRFGEPSQRHAREPGAHSANPLELYFDSNISGPGIWKWRHYFDIYHRHFSRFVGLEVHVLEIGIYSGGSIGMWKSYFGPKCHVYGVDIQSSCKAYESEGVRIFIGDQADPAFWRRFKEEVPTLDIVIDDGGHMSHQQIVTLEELLPHLRPGGVYLCEDIYDTFNPFHHYVSGLTHHLNASQLAPSVQRPHEGIRPNAFQRAVRSVHLYPFVVVIERADTPIEVFVAPKHGTQWQPWL